jgi:signal transduction histidine kinase
MMGSIKEDMLSLSLFLFITTAVLFLGGVIFVHDPRAKAQRYFLFWIIFIVIWMVSSYLENEPGLSESARTLCIHLDFFFGPLAQAPLMLFVLAFTNPKISRWKELLSIVPIVACAVITWTPFHVTDVYFSDSGAIQFTPGDGFLVFVVLTTLYFIVPVIMLFWHRRHATPQVKGQVTAIATGLALTSVILLTINLFLQDVLTVDEFRIGIYSMIFFVLGVGYAIIRHEFLKVRFVVVEILLLGILSVILGRLVFSASLTEVLVNAASFMALLVLGLALTRSFLKEVQQRVMLQDLTKKLEVANTRLKSANGKLKELDVLKTEFLSIATHQLRTPLAVTKGYISTLSEGMLGKLSPEQRKALVTVDQSNESLILLVNHLLDLTRIESGKLQVKAETVDLTATCAWVTNFLKPKAKEGGLTLTCVAPKEPVVAKGDQEKFKEVVMNLVDNAVKYTPKGGVTVTIARDKKTATIEVKDTGYGLTEKDRQHLFEKFARGSASKNVKTSSGIGLYVVKKLVEAMNGTVVVESAGPGKGSAFTVRLPLAKR